jgi:hypothetical protein
VSVASAQVTVGTTATLLNTTAEKDSVYGKEILVQNRGAADIFVGPAGVTVSTGFKIATTDVPLQLKLGPTEDLYGVAAAPQTAHVLLTGV